MHVLWLGIHGKTIAPSQAIAGPLVGRWLLGRGARLLAGPLVERWLLGRGAVVAVVAAAA